MDVFVMDVFGFDGFHDLFDGRHGAFLQVGGGRFVPPMPEEPPGACGDQNSGDHATRAKQQDIIFGQRRFFYVLKRAIASKKRDRGLISAFEELKKIECLAGKMEGVGGPRAQEGIHAFKKIYNGCHFGFFFPWSGVSSKIFANDIFELR